VKAGLAAVPDDCEGAVILLGDMPLVSAPVINALIAAIKSAPDKAAAVPVINSEWGNPVLLMRKCFADVSKLTGDAGARKYLMGHRDQVLEVPVTDSAVLVDLDTPEALARARIVT
jgi:molybdenum cofactor cytidylyltransferase